MEDLNLVLPWERTGNRNTKLAIVDHSPRSDSISLRYVLQPPVSLPSHMVS
jgi:hypothetical protein